jgi:hypothetical protein
MKALIGNAFLIGLAVAAASVAGCSFGSSPSGHPGTAQTTDDGTGSIGLQLTLAGGDQINTVSYTVNGPNGASTIVTTGSVPVGNSTSIFFQTPDNIPPGAGYTITLTGGDDAGDTCLGTSAPFTVTARTSTPVLVELQCHSTAATNGSVSVTGVTSNCATWNSISPATSDIVTGVADPVAFSAVGPALSALAYTATVSGAGAATISPASGTLTAGSGSFSVTCTTPGLVTVSVVFSDGALPTGGSCDPTLDTVTFPVQCEGQAIVIDSGTTPPPVDSGVAPVDSGIDTGTTTVDSGVDSGIVNPRINEFLAVLQQYAGAARNFTSISQVTQTELRFLNKDVENIVAGTDTNDPVVGYQCTNCMMLNDCLDSPADNKTTKECGDLTGAGTLANGTATTQTQLCLDTLACTLGQSPDVANSPVAPTTPGQAFTGTTCATGAIPQVCFCGSTPQSQCGNLAQGTGACEAVEAEGLEIADTNAPAVLKAYGTLTLGSGLANQMYSCAGTNGCTTCLQ